MKLVRTCSTCVKPGIYNEDSYKKIKELPDSCIDLVITDPPYEIYTKGGGLYRTDMKYVKELEGISNGFDFSFLDELCRVMKKINIYIWCSQKQIIPLLKYFVEYKGCNYNIITWHKTNPIPACGNKYLTDTEFCLFFREKGVKIFGSYETKFTYTVTPLNIEDKKLYNHPTVKPLNLTKNFILNSSEEGDLVFDPFSGSGTTYKASIELNRRCLSYEICEDYYHSSIIRCMV